MARIRVLGDIREVEQILRGEGFEDTPLQVVKQGQVFGLVKKLNYPWEMHVRGFENNELEAEIEVSREYLEHLNDRYRRPAINELTSFLDRYGVPYIVKGDMSGVTLLEEPETLTPWKPIVFVLSLIGIMYLLSKKRT